MIICDGRWFLDEAAGVVGVVRAAEDAGVNDAGSCG